MKTLVSVLIFVVYAQCYGQHIVFSDSSFQKAVLAHNPPIDKNGDGFVQLLEAEEVQILRLTGKKINSMEDIKFFTNIKKLVVTDNNIKSVKLENLDSLEEFYIAKNGLVSLEMENLPSLKDLACGVNQLKEIKLTNLPKLESINCMNNQLQLLDVSNFPKLKYLTADNNKLRNLDVSKNSDLIQIVVYNNELDSIDIRSNKCLKVNIMYVDKNVRIIGTPEQEKISTGKFIKVE